MKQKLLLSLFAMLMATAAWADVRINTTNFPDSNFRNWLLEQTYGSDGKLSDDEIAEIDFLDVSGKSIKSLNGIRFFTALEELDCSNNELTALNVSGCTALTWMACWGNQIKLSEMNALVESLPSIDGGEIYVISNENEGNMMSISQVAAAKAKGWTPMCLDNNLIWSEYVGFLGIEVTTFPDEKFRKYLLAQTYGNDGIITESEIASITSIDVREQDIKSLQGIEYFTALTSLRCENNQLKSLDLSKNTALNSLECDRNQLTTLNLSKNTALEWLYCDENQLTALDVSNNTKLIELECKNNQLTALDVSKNTKLTKLKCANNQLTILNVSQNTGLKKLHCFDNLLRALDMSKNTKLIELYCYKNQIRGNAMDALVASLPVVNGESLRVIYNENEGNVMTTMQVAAAKAKGWQPCYFNGEYDNWGQEKWEEYAGGEPVNPRGDLNGDSKVDIADAVSILNLMAEGGEDSAADLNGDGKVDIADFVSVLNLMAGQ